MPRKPAWLIEPPLIMDFNGSERRFDQLRVVPDGMII